MSRLSRPQFDLGKSIWNHETHEMTRKGRRRANCRPFTRRVSSQDSSRQRLGGSISGVSCISWSLNSRFEVDRLQRFLAGAWAARFLLLFLSLLSVRGESLNWETGQGFRRAKANAPQTGQVGFRKLEANQR